MTLGLPLEEVWASTPAQIFLYYDKYLDAQEIQDFRNAQLCQLAIVPHLNPGDSKKGIPPAKAPELREFMLFKRKNRRGGSLKFQPRPGGDHNLYGARTDRGAWESASGRHRKSTAGGRPKWARSTRGKYSGR